MEEAEGRRQRHTRDLGRKRHVLTWESFQEATLIKRIFCRFIIVATIASPRSNLSVCMVACLVATQSSVPAASVASSPNSYATAAPYRSSLFNHDVPHRCPRCHALRRVRAARARALAPSRCAHSLLHVVRRCLTHVSLFSFHAQVVGRVRRAHVRSRVVCRSH